MQVKLLIDDIVQIYVPNYDEWYALEEMFSEEYCDTYSTELNDSKFLPLSIYQKLADKGLLPSI